LERKLFGLGFLNSGFLIALGAIALPVIIHLLNRRRVRKIPFSSLTFIYELSRRRMRKVNLRRILILILRTLAILFIVLTFAKPTLRSAAAFLLPGAAPKSVIIALDASYSMGVDWATGTAFTRAKEVAKQVVDDTGKDDLVNVVVFSSRTEVLFEKGTRNKQLLKRAIDRAELTLEGTSIERAVQAAYDMTEQSDLGYGEVYVISDFRFSGDSTLVSTPPEGCRVMLLPIQNDAVGNVSIDRVLVPRKLIRQGEVARISVVVSNHSREDPADFPLELVVDGKRKAEKVIHLDPAASATADFSIAFNQWGTYHGTVRKSTDRLPFDDERHFILEVSKSVPVTLIRGRKQPADGSSTASYFYVDRALNPRRTDEGEFIVRVVDERALTSSDLPKKGVIVWTDPQLQFDQRRMSLIERYVHGGGSMMIFLGSGGREVWREKKFAEFIGIQGGTQKTGVKGERLTSFQKDHPIFDIFSEEELELLSRAAVRAHASVRGAATDSVIAYLSGGDPAIWECTRGKGKLIVMAITPDLESGDFPLSPMFLPLVHTSVSYLASSERAGRMKENIVGAELFFDLPEVLGVAEEFLTVKDGEGAQLRPVVYDTPQGERAVIIERPRMPGFYKLLADTTTIAEAVVNLDTKESDLNPGVFEEQVIGDASVVETGDEFAKNLHEEKEGREIFGFFLILAAAALVAESMLGRKA
jgi:hypothetical protein